MAAMKETLKRYAQFFVASLVGTGADCLVLWLCSEVVFEGDALVYGLAPVISYESGILVDFCLYYFVVWRDRVYAPGMRSFVRHLVPFHLSNLGAFLCKSLALLLFAKWTGCHVVVCELLGLGVSGLVNFACNELLIFGKRGKKRDL